MGYLIKKMFVSSQFWEAEVWPRPTDHKVLDELRFWDGHENSGCSIQLLKLGRTASCRLEIFDDGWDMFENDPEIVQILRGFHKKVGTDSRDSWDSMIKAFLDAGWIRQIPEKIVYKPIICRAHGFRLNDTLIVFPADLLAGERKAEPEKQVSHQEMPTACVCPHCGTAIQLQGTAQRS